MIFFPFSQSTGKKIEKKILFIRDFQKFQGGHLKVWNYFCHVLDHGKYEPFIFFSDNSVWDSANPWRRNSENIVKSVDLNQYDALFFAGLDWESIKFDKGKLKRQPIINFIQGFSHTNPSDPKYLYLKRKAIRICVSLELKQALTNTGIVNGPIFSIPNGIAVENENLIKFKEKKNKIVILGTKQKIFSEKLYNLISKENLEWEIEVIKEPISRRKLMDKIAVSKIAILLPFEKEGFYLPALEAMLLKSLVICPDCVGNRSFCRDFETCLVPEYSTSSILNTLKIAVSLNDNIYEKMTNSAYAFAKKSIDIEKKLFYGLLDNLESIVL